MSMGCKKCGRCCQEFSYELNGDELWVKKFIKLLEVMRLRSLLRIVKKVKIILRCKYLDENNLCKIYEKRPKRCRDFLCKEARVDKKEVAKLDKVDYVKEVWELLKEYRDSKTMTLEEVNDKIIALTTKEKGGKKKNNNEEVIY